MPENFKYKISVIVPVYNCADYLDSCFESLKKQTMKFKDFQIVLVNDGSSDNSAEICENFAKQYDNVVFFSKENEGVSATRNKGISLAEGKYFLFLDADDTLTENSLKEVYRFFENHYDEVDVVTYKIIPYFEEKTFQIHSRYRILKETGVYDLNEGDNCFITQTTMNFCVKNRRDKNITFDTTLAHHEDLEFCWRNLKDKMKIGYVEDAQYMWLRHPGSASSKEYAYYIFERTMHMWETLFAEFEGREVPRYLQALFLNDINWKTRQDYLLPYHYDDEKFREATDRIIRLLKKVDDYVILRRPITDLYHRHFLLKLKGSDSVKLECDDDEIRLVHPDEEEPVFKSKKIQTIVTEFKVDGNNLHVDGFLKSPVLMYCDEPELYLIKDGKREKLTLTHSDHERYHAQIKTAIFWRYQYDIEIDKTESFELEVDINGHTYKLGYYYADNVPLQRFKKKRVFFRDDKCFREESGVFTIKKDKFHNVFPYPLFILLYNFLFFLRINPRILYYRIIALFAKCEKKKNNRKIWLYLDRFGLTDNAYLQFKHDISKQDGIERYYVLNECDIDKKDEWFTKEEQKHLVIFGSKIHKQMYFTCDKIITSFSHLSNISPFGAGPMKWYADLKTYEVIYLQHGILHATLKNMYNKERCVVDKVVVSSGFEVKNFTSNYSYNECDLIKSGMPRFDTMKCGGEKKNRIQFTPSWRGNLIGPLKNNEREERRDVFAASAFYREVNAFLKSEKLHRLLEENDLYLDFRNHPIFKCYNDMFEIDCDRIKTDDFDTSTDEYLLMITDYSSIVFDSVYQNCPVLYFVPDYEMFRAGVCHGYRKLDLPLEEAFGPFTQTCDDLLDELEKMINNKFASAEPYETRMKEFFLYRDEHCRDRIYDSIK